MSQLPDDLHEKVVALVAPMTVDGGAHGYLETGHCVMELVTYAGNQVCGLTTNHTDQPYHADAILTNVMMSVNDSVHGDNRQLLKELVPWLVGSHVPDLGKTSQKRGLLLAKAFFIRNAARLSKGMCQQVCPVSKLIIDDNPKALELWREIIRYENWTKYCSTDQSILRKMHELMGGKVSVYLLVHIPNDLEAERTELQFFINTMINILRET